MCVHVLFINYKEMHLTIYLNPLPSGNYRSFVLLTHYSNGVTGKEFLRGRPCSYHGGNRVYGQGSVRDSTQDVHRCSTSVPHCENEERRGTPGTALQNTPRTGSIACISQDGVMGASRW